MGPCVRWESWAEAMQAAALCFPSCVACVGSQGSAGRGVLSGVKAVGDFGWKRFQATPHTVEPGGALFA